MPHLFIIKFLSMEKLKLKAIDFGTAELLSKEQLRNVLGGDGSGGTNGFPGGCCVHTSTWNGYQCGLTSAQAQNLFDGGNGGWDNWCCDQCQTSWDAAH